MQKTGMTLKEFEQFVLLPENAERRFELIDGEIVEDPPRGTWYSGIAHRLSFPVHQFCKEKGQPRHTSGAGGAYNILGNVIAPKFAYKHAPMSDELFDPIPPDWAVQIIAPNDLADIIRRKRQIYQDAGILYWEMYPKTRSIDVYAQGQAMRVVGIDGTLDGGNVLPGFTLAAHELFGE